LFDAATLGSTAAPGLFHREQAVAIPIEQKNFDLFCGEQHRSARNAMLLPSVIQLLPEQPEATSKESVMQGEITKYRDDIGFGIIMTDDGRRYRFARNQVISRAADLVGQEVDFVISGNQPAEIIVLSGSPWNAFGGIAGTA